LVNIINLPYVIEILCNRSQLFIQLERNIYKIFNIIPISRLFILEHNEQFET
jgi:hypothetical protein